MSRLDQLKSYLLLDTENSRLLNDVAHEAYSVGDLSTAQEMVDRLESIGPLEPSIQNLAGLIALRQHRLEEAEVKFSLLISNGFSDAHVRFNMGWIKALRGDFQSALAHFDDEVIAAVPRAASLKVQSMQHLGQIEEAVIEGERLLECSSSDNELLGALAVASMDADNLEKARKYAEIATGGADAMSTRGLLILDGDDPRQALALFDEVLVESPKAPRALVGRGLSLLALGQPVAAAQSLEEGAGIFEDHLGSWIAAGWAWLVAGDRKRAQIAFETALQFDDNFAETHGALAVIDILNGELDSARRKAEISSRLDKESLGGTLARTLLLEADGKPELASKVLDHVLNQGIGTGGKTISQAMSGFVRPGREKLRSE